jgi:hypothetical protein
MRCEEMVPKNFLPDRMGAPTAAGPDVSPPGPAGLCSIRRPHPVRESSGRISVVPLQVNENYCCIATLWTEALSKNPSLLRLPIALAIAGTQPWRKQQSCPEKQQRIGFRNRGYGAGSRFPIIHSGDWGPARYKCGLGVETEILRRTRGRYGSKAGKCVNNEARRRGPRQ